MKQILRAIARNYRLKLFKKRLINNTNKTSSIIHKKFICYSQKLNMLFIKSQPIIHKNVLAKSIEEKYQQIIMNIIILNYLNHFVNITNEYNKYAIDAKATILKNNPWHPKSKLVQNLSPTMNL